MLASTALSCEQFKAMQSRRELPRVWRAIYSSAGHSANMFGFVFTTYDNYFRVIAGLYGGATM